MQKMKPVALAVAAALAGLPAAVGAQQQATQDLERVEITGSRIKRVDVEGALPVTVISREEIEASGATTVAEFIRLVPFASTGNFRPQSGSSAQSLAEVDLRGLGAERTLVLIDGRRAAKGPMIGDRVDLNTIPMAIVERVEILLDGASAIYGSDAIAGVVNFITKKQFEGIEVMLGASRPVVTGGNRDEGHAIIGTKSEKGSVVGGVSFSTRDIIFARDRPWPVTRGASVYGNNYNQVVGGVEQFTFTGIPGGCNEPNFYLVGASCRYDFTQVAADEASTQNVAAFMRGEYQIAEDWKGFLGGGVSRVKSFGRYAPTPAFVPLSATSPANPTPGTPVNLYHRFAAAGPRDTTTDNNYYNVHGGVDGTIGTMDVTFGVRRSDSQYYELGRNYIVRDLAAQAINSGAYNLTNPSQNPESVLNGIKATINRDARFLDEELYVTGSMPIFQMGGGAAQLGLSAEYRKETFKDQYDSLQEAGAIEGSAGNSSGGDRNIKAFAAEFLMPITKAFEASLSARYEDYSDYGSDFSPKVALRWKPLDSLLLRGSYGQGFRAPSLPILTQKTTFSAESVVDPVSCAVLNPGEDDCQVNTYTIANPELDSEKSEQFSFGVVWEPTQWLSLKADYWNIKITDVITQITAQDLVDRSNGTDPRAIPPGLGVTRDPAGIITRIDSGYANEGTLKTDGVDLSIGGNFGLGSWGRLRSEIRYTYVMSYEEGGFDFSGSIGQPQDRGAWLNSWQVGSVTTSWNINYIGANKGAPNSTDARSVPAWITHDIQVSWKTPVKGNELVLGVVNAFNELPQRVNFDGREFNFNLYDAYGRTPYFRVTQQF